MQFVTSNKVFFSSKSPLTLKYSKVWKSSFDSWKLFKWVINYPRSTWSYHNKSSSNISGIIENHIIERYILWLINSHRLLLRLKSTSETFQLPYILLDFQIELTTAARLIKIQLKNSSLFLFENFIWSPTCYDAPKQGYDGAELNWRMSWREEILRYQFIESLSLIGRC